MVRDYLASGFSSSPLTFAKDYYLHYPRVAFGLWPPLFHALNGVWMLLFGPGRMAALSLLAVITTMWGYFFYRSVKPAIGIHQALLCSLLLVTLPSTQSGTMAVMLDIPVALTILLAINAYGKYLETETTQDAIRFGVLASIAILVKYNGLALALVPPVSIVLTHRYYLLRRKSFWLPAIIVVVLTGPWYVLMRRLVIYAAEDVVRTGSIWAPAQGNLLTLVDLAGPVIFALTLFGGFWVIRRSSALREPSGAPSGVSGLHVVSVAIIASTWIFHSFLYPIVESRYLLPAAPAIILLATIPLNLAFRAFQLTDKLGRGLAASGLVVTALMYSALTSKIPQKNTSAFVNVAEKLSREPLSDRGVILVSSDGPGEGMLVAEVAMHQRRPGHTVARASKILARQRLMGQEYQLLYHTPDEVMRALDSLPVTIAVMEECPVGRCGAHSALLTDTVARMPDRWQLIDGVHRENGALIRIYRLRGNEGKPLRSIQMDMGPTLGEVIGKNAGYGHQRPVSD